MIHFLVPAFQMGRLAAFPFILFLSDRTYIKMFACALGTSECILWAK